MYIYIHIYVHVYIYITYIYIIITYIYIYMVFTTEGFFFFRSSYRKLARVGFEPTTTEFRSDALTDSQIELCTVTPISSLCSVFTFYFRLCLCQSQHLFQAKSCTGNHVSSGMN